MKIKKIKSQNDGFIKVQMAFQEGFEPPTDSLEGIFQFQLHWINYQRNCAT